MNKVVIAALVSLAVSGHATQALSQEAAPGQKLFQQRCGACHQLETPRNGVGPHLLGVVGRTAGSVDGFRYSAALKGSAIAWTSETLETFLSNPAAMVRGTRMTQRFNNADERRAIIAFLGAQ
ncbi:c-type cytochrome [Sinorhizobium meliloti]|uniref:c-type cytochrome n=1 Tax=Rhizobium meliloti TaxID=382 RepID=UPI000C673ACD|nr:cytochrome c family protein [Sinorhizobium meliloti]PII37908.1 cytochrome C [Sinorhizobium meliloti CCBAU 01290]RVE89383.1 cytochrome c family protein [Sinorhizobium meliloti]RVH30882.1 cytochrome c family protein [Sinorhizobium meliloti]